MKSSIKVALSFALFLLLGFHADAQRRGGPANPEDMAAKQTEAMTEKLGLSNDQAAKVETINLAYAKKMQEAREGNADNRSAMQEIATAINNEKATELKTVLTAEQFKKYEEMQASKPSRKGKGKGKQSGK